MEVGTGEFLVAGATAAGRAAGLGAKLGSARGRRAVWTVLTHMESLGARNYCKTPTMNLRIAGRQPLSTRQETLS